MTGFVNKPRLLSYLLCFSLCFKIVGLESFTTGWPHHLSNGVTALVFVAVAGEITKSLRAAIIMGVIAVTSWCMDVANIPPGRLDVEALLWCSAHVYLTALVARELAEMKKVGRKEILDAISVYLASGLAFAEAYSMLLGRIPTRSRSQPRQDSSPSATIWCCTSASSRRHRWATGISSRRTSLPAP